MSNSKDSKMRFINDINSYYTNKVKQFGLTHLGVDWNSRESQFLRFEQLCKVIDKGDSFSLIDYGCGYGAMVEFLNNKFSHYLYIGYDISDEMILNAQKHFRSRNHIFTTNKNLLNPVDYVIASGIFNVKLDIAIADWEKYLRAIIFELNKLSICGFAFNMLSTYSDKEYIKDYLYYADPLFYFDFCKKTFSKNVALLHDYNLYEFTLLIRK